MARTGRATAGAGSTVQQVEARLDCAAVTSLQERRVNQLIDRIKPSQASDQRRKVVASYVKELISECFQPEHEVIAYPFGSVPLRTYLPDGDIDLSLFLKNGPPIPDWVDRLASYLEQQQGKKAHCRVTDVQRIIAEVKLVKCLVDNIVVDITCDSEGGLCTVAFLEAVDRKVQDQHLFKRSIILVKAWCYYESRLLGAHHGLLSTYALETLVLYLFFHYEVASPLKVLHKFLRVFGEFEWDQYCLSLDGPIELTSLISSSGSPAVKKVHSGEKPHLPLKVIAETQSWYHPKHVPVKKDFQRRDLNIMDPLLPGNNLGRSMNKTSFLRMRKALRLGAMALANAAEQDGNGFDAIDRFFRNTWNAHRLQPQPLSRGDSQLDSDGQAHASENGIPGRRTSSHSRASGSGQGRQEQSVLEAREFSPRGMYPFYYQRMVGNQGRDPGSPVVTPPLDTPVHMLPTVPLGYQLHMIGMPVAYQVANFRGQDFYLTEPPPTGASDSGGEVGGYSGYEDLAGNLEVLVQNLEKARACLPGNADLKPDSSPSSIAETPPSQPRPSSAQTPSSRGTHGQAGQPGQPGVVLGTVMRPSTADSSRAQSVWAPGPTPPLASLNAPQPHAHSFERRSGSLPDLQDHGRGANSHMRGGPRYARPQGNQPAGPLYANAGRQPLYQYQAPVYHQAAQQYAGGQAGVYPGPPYHNQQFRGQHGNQGQHGAQGHHGAPGQHRNQGEGGTWGRGGGRGGRAGGAAGGVHDRDRRGGGGRGAGPGPQHYHQPQPSQPAPPSSQQQSRQPSAGSSPPPGVPGGTGMEPGQVANVQTSTNVLMPGLPSSWQGEANTAAQPNGTGGEESRGAAPSAAAPLPLPEHGSSPPSPTISIPTPPPRWGDIPRGASPDLGAATPAPPPRPNPASSPLRPASRGPDSDYVLDDDADFPALGGKARVARKEGAGAPQAESVWGARSTGQRSAESSPPQTEAPS